MCIILSSLKYYNVLMCTFENIILAVHRKFFWSTKFFIPNVFSLKELIDTSEKQLTAPNATHNIVCIFLDSTPVPALVKIPFFPVSSLPVTVQNLTCLTPTDTNWLSESGRNSALNILWVWPGVVATLEPERNIGFLCRTSKLI